MKRLLCLALLFFVSNALGNPLELENEDQITRAKEMHEAIAVLSSKVTDCVDKEKKPIEECACYNLENCQFKAEFKEATEIYCNLRMDFPKWKQKTINYYVKESNESVALGMTGLETVFGKYCKK